MKFDFFRKVISNSAEESTKYGISGREAYETTLKSKCSKWPSRGRGNRIEPFCLPSINARHSFSKDDQIFTMGSCFARNIERALLESGHDVPSANITFPKEELWQGTGMHSGLLNKYTPQSMLNELEYVFNNKYVEEDFLVEGAKGEYYDFQLHTNLPVTFERGIERRKEIKSSIKSFVNNADVVIITLGLVEVWRDNQNGVYLNETPPKKIIDQYPDRFTFEVMSPQDVFGSVSAIINLLKGNTKDNTWIMLTVSPVPLSRTFREQDVITANMYSKSVLKVAAEIETEKSTDVEYFPSYESVVLSERTEIWEEDQIHIKYAAIKKITQRVIDNYASENNFVLSTTQKKWKEGGKRLIAWGGGEVTGTKAYKTTLKNRHSKWPSRGGGNRIEPFCLPNINTQHSFSKGDQIFTMGSCFARNIERALLESGHDVPSANITFPKEELWQGTGMHSGLLNKYTPQSMLNELEYVFNNKYVEEDFLVEGAKGEYYDFQLHTNLPVTFERGIERRKEIKSSIKSFVNNADVVILTLGLVEVWRDNQNGVYLNETPPKRIIDQYPDRFTFEVMPPQDVFSCVSDIISLLKGNTKDNTWIMLTVSPVPLSRTFREQDVITANMYSKSVLKVAAEIETEKSADVEYFPSYESVVLSERAEIWEEDQIHIKYAAIKKITQRVVDNYTKEN